MSNKFNMFTDNTQWREPFPFVTEDGSPSLVTYAVDDLVIWAKPEAELPIHASASLKYFEGYNELSVEFLFTDISDVFSASVSEHSEYIMDADGILSGIIKWNNKGLDALRSSLRSSNNHQNPKLMVSPAVCLPRTEYPLATVTLNGEPLYGDSISIMADADTGVQFIDGTETGTLNMMAKPEVDITNIHHQYAKNLKPIEGIIVDDSESKKFDITGDVWLRSGAECDIRVITEDRIIISEVTNDSLR